MKLKLTNNELSALCGIVERGMLSMQKEKEDKVFSMEDKLSLALIEKLWVTLKRKWFTKKNNHNLNLPAELTIFFFLLFRDEIDTDNYTQNVIRKICNQIHQHFA